MPTPTVETINEVDFCAKVASAANAIFAERGDSPFAEVRIEGLGSSRSKQARKDLRFYGRDDQILLTGEVKLPGKGNANAFDSKVIKDAADKAEEANTKYFFTWDVNTFVLWDRSLWDKPLFERRVNVWPLRLNLANPQEVARKESLDFIVRKFLPDLLRDLAEIVTGHRSDWSLPPDEIFLRALESHLEWPVALLRNYLQTQAEEQSAFDKRLQEWMQSQDRVFFRKDPDEWRNAVDNAAQTLCYIWTNRFIFYKALRSRFPELSGLDLAPSVKTPAGALKRLNELFRRAADRSGDYESLLFPEMQDWATDLVFEPVGAVDAWRGFLKSIESVDFRDVPADVVGLIFQKLISPEERHRFGQHFTGPDAVDLINAFCIRNADDAVLDPACGSGSFLVRAYYRKRAMNDKRSHLALLGELFGCDIALYPAHLATLNLAAREINDEANYPRIDRRDFFEYVPGAAFCHLPEHKSQNKVPIPLPELDAVVGNPPYVRQEKVEKAQKPHLALLMNEAFPGTKLSGRADLHCYFWPHAAQFLREGGYFGFLTSSQWLDVDYGFALQRWILRHFRIVAILESATERWFPDARVKTCIAILQRCSDHEKRHSNPVRFVRFEKPLAEIIGVPATGGIGPEAEDGERRRQKAVDKLRDKIEAITRDVHDDKWRILVKRQGELWDDGVRAGRILKNSHEESADEEGDEEGEADSSLSTDETGDYAAGKWGRYLRAPDLYFEILNKFKNRFVPLGEIVEIRRGITSGCDAFFMPWDVTETMLAEYPTEVEFIKTVGVPRKDVVSGKLRIIEDGAGLLHPIESIYLSKVVHSLRDNRRSVIRPESLEQVVLLVSKSTKLQKTDFVSRYIKYGEITTFSSKKSKPVPVPFRSSCAGRDPWYDLTTTVHKGYALWPLSHQYLHVIPNNPNSLIANKRMITLLPNGLSHKECDLLVPILNSTLIGLLKSFYGRYTGTEGALGTDVLDVNLIDVPDPRDVEKAVANRLHRAFKSICKRDSGRLVEESLMSCHSYDLAMKIAAGPIVRAQELRQADRRELDDAVFELLGVTDPAERHNYIERLYDATAEHFRAIRVTEIQKMEDRKKGSTAKSTAKDQAQDAWNSLDLADVTPLADWLQAKMNRKGTEISIPPERPVLLSTGTFNEDETVYFGKRKQQYVECESREQAELVARIGELGVTGPVRLPSDAEGSAALLKELNARHESARIRLRELANSRSGESAVQDQIFELLERWFVLGKS